MASSLRRTLVLLLLYSAKHLIFYITMWQQLKNKTVLFISPVFYGYEKIIAKQMTEEGASVIFFPEREYSTKYKLINNLKNSNLGKLQDEYYSDIYNKIKNLNIDYLFVIRGFMMPLSFIEKFRDRFSAATLIMHQWDSMLNNNYEKCLNKFDSFFSFDPADCSKYPVLKYLPNFYLPEYKNAPKKKSSYDISFIGWAYKDRLEVIKKVKQQLSDKTIYKYCYLPISAYIKKMLHGNFLSDIKFHSLSLNEVFNIVMRSFSVLDITDSKQSGYTYRSIDAMAAGKKLISTNTLLMNESFYNPNNILIINRDKPVIDTSFFETSFQQVNVEDYSLQNWVRKVFSN